MTTLTLFLLLIGVFQCVRAAELQWSSRVQHGRNFSCPGEQIVFTCTVNSAAHIWNITSENNPSDSIVVAITPSALNPISPNPSYSFGAFVNASARIIVSTATVIATPSIGTINVRCQAPLINSDDDVLSVRAVFLDASWTFIVNAPSSERPLSDLSMNISMDERARQCVDSFNITDNNNPSLRCTGDRNARTVSCPPQNFCQQRMYSLNGSTTTAFSVPSPIPVDYNPQIPSVLFPGGPSVSYMYMYGANGLVVAVTWQVIDNVVMNRNTVAVNASLSVSGQQNNGVFLNDTSKRFTFNSSQLIDVQQDTLAVNISLVFVSGSCSERISERFQVTNAISVVEDARLGGNTIRVRFNRDLYPPGLAQTLSAHLNCDQYQPEIINRTYDPLHDVIVTFESSPTATNCSFTLHLLSNNNEVIGFPIQGVLDNQSIPAITSFDYDTATLTLTCVSSGGPVDSVTWMKDGVEITGDNSDFSQSQIITDASSATYQHTLSVRNVLHFVGRFTCIVRDVVGNNDTRDLTTCPVGHYISRACDNYSACVPCPSYSITTLESSDMCKCLCGYYRSPQEDIHVPCTRPPSACTDLTVDHQRTRNNSITVRWNRPAITGREDYYYNIHYSNPDLPGNLTKFNANPYISTSPFLKYTVSGLRPLTNYTIRVTVHNGVSDQDLAGEEKRWCEVAATSGEIYAEAPRSVGSFRCVVYWKAPSRAYGVITGYEVCFFLSGKNESVIVEKKRDEFFHIVNNRELSVQGDTHVKVRARTKSTNGAWSNFITLDCPSACP